MEQDDPTTDPGAFDEDRRTLIERLKNLDVAVIRELSARRRDGSDLTQRSWEQLTLGPSPWADADTEVDPGDVSLVTALSTHLMAAYITAHTSGARQAKMRRVTARQREGLRELFAEVGMPDTDPDALMIHMIDGWPAGARTRLLIDLNFTDPFFPYDLRVDGDDFEGALRWVARHIGIGDGVVDEIVETRRDAERAHSKARILKIVVGGAGGLVLLGAGGWALAPVLGSALGASAGLSGAAATAHGLALLGGGTVAAGGAGMAGGLFLVTGTGAAVGAVGGGGAAFLLGVGAKQAQLEMVRLQVTYKMILLEEQLNSAKAAAAVKSLQAQITEMETMLAAERELNDRNSHRLDEFEKKVKAMRNAATWMDEQGDQQPS